MSEALPTDTITVRTSPFDGTSILLSAAALHFSGISLCVYVSNSADEHEGTATQMRMADFPRTTSAEPKSESDDRATRGDVRAGAGKPDLTERTPGSNPHC